jgi:nitrate/nitrite-specific signal transduction histidine kinase
MKKNWWSSLRAKIFAWSFVPTAIILSAVAWFTFFSYQKVVGDLAIKQDQEIVQSKMEQISAAFNNLVGPVIVPIYYLDRNPELSLEARAQNILDQIQGLEIFDGGIYFLDQQGKVFLTRPAQLELIGQDWSGTPWFRFIREYPNTAGLSDLLSLGPSGKKVVCSAVALTSEQGEFIGAGYFCYLIYPATQNAYYQALNSVDFGPRAYVLDRNLQIVFSPDASQMGQDMSGETYLQQILQSESKSGRFQNGTEDLLVSYIPFIDNQDAVGWIVMKEQSWAEIMQPSWLFLSSLLALGVVAPVLVSAYGIRHITKPIQKLIQASEQVTAGQFKQRIEVRTGDEIETLADRFNLMSAKLDDSYASLEKKVADRTRELAVVNAIVSVASQSLDIQEILMEALSETVEQMDFEAGAAFRLNVDSTATQLVAQQGFEPISAIDLARCCAITSQVQTTETAPKVTTYALDEHQENHQALRLSQAGFHLLVSVPLAAKGSTLGLFLLGKRTPSPLSLEELALLSSIGKQVGVAMENARLYEQAEQVAITAERNRLARELHDAVTQTLFSASLIADVIPRIWKRNPDEGMQNLEELRQLTRGALAEMRTLLLEMRPESLERSDIKSLLTQLADAFIGRVRVPVSLVIQGDCELTHEVKIVFYRIAQEALNNIAKHAGARHVTLHLDCQPGHMNLCIQDDGLGFDVGSVPPDHMGIAIMRERASSIGACLKIDSQVGQGTTVELDWRSVQKEGSDEYLRYDPSDVGGRS